jgi:hypothetical protein
MRSAQCVGRVGGLAAAAGVGIAIWLGCPAATADDTSAGTSASSNDSTAVSSRARVGTRTSDKRVIRVKHSHADRASASVRVRSARASSARQEQPAGDDDDSGSVASPVSWMVAAAARRQLPIADVAVQAEPTRVSVVGTVSRTGHQTTSAQFNADGSQATVTTSSLRLLTNTRIIQTSVYDTDTGRQIGRTVITRGPALSASTASAVLADDTSSSTVTPDGSRALTITDDSTPSGYHATSVTVTDTATGFQVGDTVHLPGWPAPQPIWFGADDRHAIVTTQDYDPKDFGYIQMYSMIDTETGSKSGTTLALKGQLDGAPVFSPDRERAVFVTYSGSGNTYQTQLGVLATTTGAQIGNTLTYSSVGGWYSPIFSADGERILMLAGATDPFGRYSIRASVINTVTGTQIGKTLSFAGGNFGGSGVFSPDGAHVLMVTTQANWLSLTSTTRVSILRIS